MIIIMVRQEEEENEEEEENCYLDGLSLVHKRQTFVSSFVCPRTHSLIINTFPVPWGC